MSIVIAVVGFIALIFVFFLGAVFVNDLKQRRAGNEDADNRQTQLAASILQAHDRLTAYKNISLGEFNHMKAILAISQDDTKLAVHMLPSVRDTHEKDLKIYDITAIKSVSLCAKTVGTSTSKTKSRSVIQEVDVRKSAGGRALVGGLLLGPIGAIAGAASGLNGTKVKRILASETVGYQVYGTHTGPEFVSLEMSDNVVHQWAANDPASTRVWEHTLRTIVERNSQSPQEGTSA